MDTSGILKKLRFDKEKKALIINAPAEFLSVLKEHSYDTKLSPKKEGTYDFVQIFATRQAELEKLVKGMENAGQHDCLFWISYPKGTGKIKSDIKRETVWIAFDLIGLQAVSQIAIDETWSALRGRPVEKVGK